MFINLSILTSILCTISAFKFPGRPGNNRNDGDTCRTLADLSSSRVLDLEKFQGHWYFYAVYLDPSNFPGPPFDPYYCFSANFTKMPPSQKGKLVFMESCLPENEGDPVDCIAFMYKIDETEYSLESPWHMVDHEGEDFSPLMPEISLIWLQTDNDNWALGYLCLEENSSKLENMFILTRQPEFDNEEVINVLHSVMENYGFLRDHVIPVHNKNCDEN